MRQRGGGASIRPPVAFMTPSANVAGQSLGPVLVFVAILSLLALWFLYVSFAHRRRFQRAGGSSSGMITPADNQGLAIITVFLVGFSSVVLALTVPERSTAIARYWLLMAVLAGITYAAARLRVRMGDVAGRDRDLAKARVQQLRIADSTSLARMGLRLPIWIVGGVATVFGLIATIAAGQNVFGGTTAGAVPTFMVAVLLLAGGCSAMYAAHRMSRRDAERLLARAAAANAPGAIRGPTAGPQLGPTRSAVVPPARSLVGVVVSLFVGGVGFIVLMVGFFVIMGARELKSWLPASAEIVGTQLSSSWKKDPQTDRSTLEYGADVHYRFTVDGRVRTSVLKSVYTDDNRATVTRYIDTYYGRGKVERIVYDPADPSRIALQPSSNNEKTGAVIGAVGLLILAGAALVLVRSLKASSG